VCFVDDNGATFRKDVSAARSPVDRVGNKQVMVANLEWILVCVTGVQKDTIAAINPLTVTDLRYTNPLPIIAAEMNGFVEVQFLSEG
jgi:hypothetical protein